MAVLRITFDDERELTVRELILLHRMATGDLDALLALVQSRSKYLVPRQDLECLPLSEMRRLCDDLETSLQTALSAAAAAFSVTPVKHDC